MSSQVTMRLFFCFSPGEYSCLSVDLVFKRQFSYYLITIYVPCCMLVIVSWVNTIIIIIIIVILLFFTITITVNIGG